MSWRTHPLVIWCRSLGRRAGINSWLVRARRPRGYEARFEQAMFAALRPGDVVWDVGANVGHYTAAFAARVGPAGHVVAFEPSPANFARLEQREELQTLHNVTALCLALGSQTGELPFEQGADALGATSRIVGGAEVAGDGASHAVPGTLFVPVARGAELVASGRARAPTFIKVDTEGHELEVLRGLDGLLEQPALRVLCIEMHFGLCAQNGHEQAPRDVERLLGAARFAVSWPDTSHLLAERRAS